MVVTVLDTVVVIVFDTPIVIVFDNLKVTVFCIPGAMYFFNLAYSMYFSIFKFYMGESEVSGKIFFLF